MKVYPEAYSGELNRLLPMSEVPAFRPGNEYYTLRNQKGDLLAAGVLWRSRIHPRRIRFYIGVEELYQRRGYGTMIFERMCADHPGEKWQGSAELDNDAAEWWLRGLGFEFSYRCYWLDAMVIDLMDPNRYGLRLTPMEQLNEEQKNRLVSMAWTDYVHKHEKIDPLSGEVDALSFREALLRETDEAVSCCLTEDGQIVAYVICGEADDWTTGVKMTGSRLADREKFRQFLVEFANRAFEIRGGLMMQADSFDEDALALLRLFGDLPDDSYDTYVLE